MDVQQAFGANVEMARPRQSDWGFFLIQRHPEISHNRFVVFLSKMLGPKPILLQHPTGLVVAWMSLGVSHQLKRHPWIKLIGSVQVDRERLVQLFSRPK